LEISIQKNKKYEEQITSIQFKSRDQTSQVQAQQMKIEALENDNRALSSRLKKEREALQIELEDKQSVLLRYTGEIKEIAHQKTSLKQ